MFTHPYLGSQLARERQREMQAQAGQQRLARQLREHARATRRSQRAGWRITRLLKRARPATLSLMTRTAAASSHPNWQDPSWPR
jgi:hypothetical protein